MRILQRIMILIGLTAIFAQVGLNASQQDGAWATGVKEAAKLVLSNSSKPEDIDRSLTRLLDIAITIAARDSRSPAEFQKRLQAASKAFSENPLGAKSWEALNAAYKSINGEKDFKFPDGVKTPGDASRVAKEHIDRTVKALESGQSSQAVRDILSFILLVTTPMMQQP